LRKTAHSVISLCAASSLRVTATASALADLLTSMVLLLDLDPVRRRGGVDRGYQLVGCRQDAPYGPCQNCITLPLGGGVDY
jgi:hypothetical protein